MCLDCCHKRDFLSTSSALLEAEKCLHHSDIIRRRLLKQEEKRRLRAEAKAASETTNENKDHKKAVPSKDSDKAASAQSSTPLPAEDKSLIQCIFLCFYTPILMYNIHSNTGQIVGCKGRNNPEISDCGLCFNCCQKENFGVSEEDKGGCAHHIRVNELRIVRKEEKYVEFMNARNEKIRVGNQAKVKKATPPSANVKCERDNSFFLYYC